MRTFTGLILMLGVIAAGVPAAGVPAAGVPAAGAPAEAVSSPAQPEIVTYGRFGDITIYRPPQSPHDVVLFLSGDGGWELGVLAMAQHLADNGALVAGINIRHYMAELEKAPESCVSTPDDFDKLSRHLQSKLGIGKYLQPTLAGYSSGATLVYATLAAAPAGMFKGALSIAFCPDLDLKKPLCRGEGIESRQRRDSKGTLSGVDFLPVGKLGGLWISLQGSVDAVCPAPATKKFIDQVPGAEIILLPKVGHGYSVPRNWLAQYESAFERIVGADRSAKSLTAPNGGR